MLTGGCLCGQLRYAAGGAPSNPTICHCAMCQRAAGAPMVAWFTAPRSEFRWVAGTPTRFASSDRASRSFCPRCGTSLTYESHEYPEEVDITTASLDDPGAIPPEDHIWTQSRLRWVRLADGLPAHPGRR